MSSRSPRERPSPGVIGKSCLAANSIDSLLPTIGGESQISLTDPDSRAMAAHKHVAVSLKPNSLLAGKIQGISSIRASTAPRRQQKKAPNQYLTGQFPPHPNREFFAALQGIKSADQGNFRPDQGIPLSSAILAFARCRQIQSSRQISTIAEKANRDAARCSKSPKPISSSRPALSMCAPGVPQIARRDHRRERSAFRAHDGGVGRIARAWVHRAHRRRGIEGSNPAPSSGESTANRTQSTSTAQRSVYLRGAPPHPPNRPRPCRAAPPRWDQFRRSLATRSAIRTRALDYR
jgi:hypothetical protein